MTISDSGAPTTVSNAGGRTPRSGDVEPTATANEPTLPVGRSKRARTGAEPTSVATASSTPQPVATGRPAVAYAKIYPGIGFARVGNSPDQYLLGPEIPGRPVDAGGRFKDRQGRIKRQACRFRVYGFDAEDNVVQELTAAEADITWTVHLANRKAGWAEFEGAAAEAEAADGGRPQPLRNAGVEDRASLDIDPGPRSITGAATSEPGHRFDTGRFRGVPVALGEIRTDDAGRLIVLGGAGRAESTDGSLVTDYANNDSWFDDTSDGPVTAAVTLKDGMAVPVRASSWVVVGPPDFAPAVGNLVSLYDVATSVARDAGWLPEPDTVSFTEDVFPVLSRIAGLRWVNDLARRGHGQGAAGDFLNPRTVRRLGSNDAAARPLRQRVFARLRNPNATGAEAVRQANLTYMPQLSGDAGFTQAGVPSTWFSLVPHQYEAMRRWAEGDFLPDWAGVPEVPQSLTQLGVGEQPHALDRASSEGCVGGLFFPGIEMTYTSRDPTMYAEPYRLRPDLAPGDVTKRMAVPWHADFYDCRTRWWPAQRPDEVITQTEYDAVLAAFVAAEDPDSPRAALEDLRFNTERWDRGLGENPYVRDPAAGNNDMVRAWSELAILRPEVLPNGAVVLVEGERRPYFGMKDREYFHIMLNIESYPDFLPMARELAQRFLDDARALQRSPRCPDDYRPFTYSTRVLRSRLEHIYTKAAQEADSFSLGSTSLTSRDSLVERLVQMAPFNQIDGAWLRNVGKLGPIDEIRALLFNVWSDELGNGDPKLNHSNVYTDLLHSVGVYLEPVASRAYIENETIVDSAFTSPLFQLVIAEFSEDYLPEILGMTLFLEWTVISVRPQVRAMEVLGIDPLFYSLHIGIDNAVTGHGAMARRAVELYLDEVRASSGDQAMQEVWQRIWTGYVAFATTGGLGEDLRRRVQQRPTPGERVEEMIRRKEHFGAQNHGSRTLGDNLLNNWFADPRGFMAQLVSSAYIVAGDVEGSPFFELLRPTGPMFRVFTDEEIRIWEDWTRSLSDATTAPEPDTDIGLRMVQMVTTLRPRQEGTRGHATNRLTGAAPDGTGDPVTQPVAWWFDQQPVALLAAIANPANGWVTPGDPASSRFLTELATGDHRMARTFNGVAPGTAHKTWRDIATEWIESGCPLPAVRATASPSRAAVPPDEGAPRPRGAVHIPQVHPGAPMTAVTAALSDEALREPSVPRLGLFQNETWEPEFGDVPIYGNGALH